MIKLRILFLTAILLSGCHLGAFAFDNGDFQYWSAASASFKPGEKLTAKIEEQFNFGDNAGDFFYQHLDIGFAYSGLAHWLEAGINYRQIFEEKNGDWKKENRPHASITLKWEKFDAKFSNRFRFEYRDKEDSKDTWRFRNKFIINAPWLVTGLKIRPYLADEIYYDFEAQALNRNSIFAGFNLAPFDKFNAEIYYALQKTKSDNKWTSVNILGTKLKLYF